MEKVIRVFRLFSSTGDVVYFGKTTETLGRAFSRLQSQYKVYCRTKRVWRAYFVVFRAGHVMMELCEEVKSQKQADALVKRLIETTPSCVNERRPGVGKMDKFEKYRYHREYYQRNKGRMNERQRHVRAVNREVKKVEKEMRVNPHIDPLYIDYLRSTLSHK